MFRFHSETSNFNIGFRLFMAFIWMHIGSLESYFGFYFHRKFQALTSIDDVRKNMKLNFVYEDFPIMKHNFLSKYVCLSSPIRRNLQRLSRSKNALASFLKHKKKLFESQISRRTIKKTKYKIVSCSELRTANFRDFSSQFIVKLPLNFFYVNWSLLFPNGA